MAIRHNAISRRQFLRTSAVIAASSALIACAPAAPAAQNGSGGAAPGAAPIELSYISPDRELGNKVKKIVIDGFNAKMKEEGKAFQVVGVTGPATDNDLKTKVTLDAAAGTLADIASLNAELIADFVAAGYLADLGPYLTTWPDWAQYYDILKTLSTYDGKILGLPGGSTFTFFYRKDVLTDAGISTEQPKTWDDFYAACDQIAKKTQAKPCGLPAATPWGGGTWGEGFQMVWLSFDGPIYDEADKKWVVSSPNLLKALKVYETLAKNNWLTVEELLSPNPWEPIKYQEFPEGKTAIVTGGEWQWTFDWGPTGATPIEGLFEKVDRWEFPSESGKPFTYVSGGVGDVVSSKSKSVEGCAEFIKYEGSNEVFCSTMNTYIGGPSGRKDTVDKCPDYKTIVDGKMYAASQLFETGRTYKFDRVGAAKLSDGVGRATEDIITGKSTAEQAMEDFAKSMIEALGEENAKRA
ncbi:extracellular solute-binding protein [soil metagenome]